MRFEVNADLEYYILSPSTLILNIHALRTPHQVVLEESLTVEPDVEVEELTSDHAENRFVRMEIQQATNIVIRYRAIVDNLFEIVDFKELGQDTVVQLDKSVFPYLYPSRYCQSDKLYRLAYNKFGKISNTFTKIIALTDWIYNNVEYLSGSTNSQTSAYDTVTEQAGVCRDFAHLGIALCRALTIPARYFTGYAYQLNPPDFHACFEAYLGNKWVLFDATRLAPLNGLVKIATGRDAADTAIANIFGSVNFISMNVSSRVLDDGFTPLFYGSSDYMGLTYL